MLMCEACVLMDPALVKLHFALHCHAVKKDLAKSCRERRLWKAQHFALQSALPYLPQIQIEGGLCWLCLRASVLLRLSVMELFVRWVLEPHTWSKSSLSSAGT